MRGCGPRYPGGGGGGCGDGLGVLCAPLHVIVVGGNSGCWSADYVGHCQCKYHSLGGSYHWLVFGNGNHFGVMVVLVVSFLVAFGDGGGDWWRLVELSDFSCSWQQQSASSLISWCTHNPHPPDLQDPGVATAEVRPAGHVLPAASRWQTAHPADYICP